MILGAQGSGGRGTVGVRMFGERCPKRVMARRNLRTRPILYAKSTTEPGVGRRVSGGNPNQLFKFGHWESTL